MSSGTAKTSQEKHALPQQTGISGDPKDRVIWRSAHRVK